MDSVGKYTYIEANAATTIVSPVPCTLLRIVIGDQGASANVLTVYDNASAASGNIVATVDTTEAKDTLDFGCILKNGCTVALATGTAAKVTIITT